MAVRRKRSISMPPDLDAEIAAAAAREGISYSAWLAAAARKEFTVRAGLAAIGQFEREHGAFSPDELAEADAWAAEAAARGRHTGAGSGRRSA
jgi:hypothetical protein